MSFNEPTYVNNIIQTRKSPVVIKLNAPGKYEIVAVYSQLYKGADAKGDNDSREEVSAYILPISFDGTTFANIARHIGPINPLSIETSVAV